MAMNKEGVDVKGGRKKSNIDRKAFENLCNLQCTKDDICGFFDVSEKTLTGWCKRTYGEGFSDIYKKKSSGGRISLRRMQFKKAEEGNPTMLIWLGKQYLEQSEVMRQELNVTKDRSDIADEIDKYLGKMGSD